MHTIILLLYIPYIAGGRSENLGGNLVISNSKRFFDGIGFASNSAKTGGGGELPSGPHWFQRPFPVLAQFKKRSLFTRWPTNNGLGAVAI